MHLKEILVGSFSVDWIRFGGRMKNFEDNRLFISIVTCYVGTLRLTFIKSNSVIFINSPLIYLLLKRNLALLLLIIK